MPAPTGETLYTVKEITAPPLTSITEIEWREFKQAVSTAAPERATETEIVLHVIEDETQPLDVRKYALWSLYGNDDNYFSWEAERDKEGNFFDSHFSGLNRVFNASPDLAKYGAEVGINFYESGKYKGITAHNSGASALLGASLPYIQQEEMLTTRAINALIGIPAGDRSLNPGHIHDTIGRTVVNAGVPLNIRRDLLQGMIDTPDTNYKLQHPLLDEKTQKSIAAALGYTNLPVSEPSVLIDYFDQLEEAMSKGEVSPKFENGLENPVGLERLPELEKLLGSDHPYVVRVAEETLLGHDTRTTGWYDTRFWGDLEAADTLLWSVADPDLRSKARVGIDRHLEDHRKFEAESDIKRRAAQETINNFFANRAPVELEK